MGYTPASLTPLQDLDYVPWMGDAPIKAWPDFVYAPHIDSLWADIGNAMASTVAIAKIQHARYAAFYDPDKNNFVSKKDLNYWTPDQAFDPDPNSDENTEDWTSLPVTIPEIVDVQTLDDQFVRELGHDPAYPHLPSISTAGYSAIIVTDPDDPWTAPRGIPVGFAPGTDDPEGVLLSAADIAALRPATKYHMSNDWYLRNRTLIEAQPAFNLALMPYLLVQETRSDIDTNGDAVIDAADEAIFTYELFAINSPDSPDFDPALPSYSALERSQCAEMMINDFRLSLMGSHPDYAEDFRPYDFNGDGKVACSGYNSHGPGTYPGVGLAMPNRTAMNRPYIHPGLKYLNPVSYAAAAATADWAHAAQTLESFDLANPTNVGAEVWVSLLDEYSLGIDRYTVAVVGGKATVPVNTYFSLTGVLSIGRSRFYRILCRGELYDNYFKQKVTSVEFDSVLNIDPANLTLEWNEAGDPEDPAAGMGHTNVLHQRWSYDLYRGLSSRRY
jgi:hypothetical protein